MRRPVKFGQTTKHFPTIQEEKRKYILAYEGNKTEVQYFNGLIENRDVLNINPILELIPLLRSIPDDTSSHPKKILELLEEHFHRYMTVKVIIDKIIDYIVESQWEGNGSQLAITAMKNDFQMFSIQALDLSMDDEVEDLQMLIMQFNDCIEKWCSPIRKIEDLVNYIEEQQIIFEDGYDKICIIIDRNKRNLKEYGEYLQQCNDKGYSLYVSTPDFEFWLLLHSDKVFDYDYDELMENRKIDVDGNKSSKRYLENVLSTVFNGYKKENIRFGRFLPLVDIAIKNEKSFCEDIKGLEFNLGSNIGCLIKEIRS